MTKLTTTIFALLLSSAPAYATWEEEPEPEPPVVVEPEKPIVSTPDGDSDYDTYNRIYYSVCTCTELKTAWGFESLELRTNKARMQCEQRRERISCPQKWK
jgi:hypothetical protein